MKFDQPAGQNAIDQLKVIGKPHDRIDGPLKTTGRAPYAYERHDIAAKPAYGYIVGATIAKGRIRSLRTDRAKAAPGVIAVVTAADAGPVGKGNFNTAKLLGGPEIQHYHQAIAVVVAETFEQARSAAQLVEATYARADGVYDLADAKDSAGAPKGGPEESSVGDFDAAFAAAPVTLDETYTTPDQSHAMMEPHATLASWEGDKLTLWTSNQMIAWGKGEIAKIFGIPPENVRLDSPYIGGGFGGKLFIRADAVMAALASKATKRPVKVALQRPLVANNTTHRPATIQRIRIGAERDGRITAIAHESWSGDLPGGGTEAAAQQTKFLYAGANRITSQKLATLDLPEGNAMRAPGEAPGLMALEIAMDEMSEKLGLDPVEFRIRNDTQIVPDVPPPEPSETDPQSQSPSNSSAGADRPFSQRQFIQCLRLGADRFGWSRRNPSPASVRDGRWLVGFGMAAGFRNSMVMKSAARVRLDAQGVVTVETDMTDIGTGSYTIIAQTAAETMGVELQRVVVKLGDSDFPAAAGSGGQWGANTSTAGVYAACMKLREQVLQRLGYPADAAFSGGRVRAGRRTTALASAASAGPLVAEDVIEFGDLDKQFQTSTFAGHFVEVGVDSLTAETRVRRMLAVCAAGRILNPKTARSQVIGAMTMGVGAALMEELAVDKRIGFFVNHDLASYEVPVHADIPHQEVIFLDEADDKSSPMKAKGVGELGLCGVGAAIANAVYNATGVRIRDYPLTLDKYLDRLPAAS